MLLLMIFSVHCPKPKYSLNDFPLSYSVGEEEQLLRQFSTQPCSAPPQDLTLIASCLFLLKCPYTKRIPDASWNFYNIHAWK